MANPSDTTAPRLFDRALLLERQARARKLGPVRFLLDRVAECAGAPGEGATPQLAPEAVVHLVGHD